MGGSTSEYLPVEHPPSFPTIRTLENLGVLTLDEKEDADMVRMSQGVGDRTLEGAIVCKTLSYLPAGIGNKQL